MPKKITMSALGKAVGVSTATVSYVLNGRGAELRIDPTTQKQVLKTAQRMGYKLPQSVGRGRRQVGVLYPNVLGDYMGLQVVGIQEVLREHNYNVVFCVCDDDPSVEQEDMDMYLRRRVQGVIAFPCEDEQATERWSRYQEHDPNVVFIGRRPPGMTGSPCIEVDNTQVGREAADILMREGCQNFVVVSEKPEYDKVLPLRRKGFLDALQELNRPRAQEFHWRSFSEIIQFLTNPPPNTGIFAVRNSILFPSVYMALKRRQTIHPDLAFAGVGSMDRAYALPNRFWVARNPAREMGRAAALAILAELGEIPDRSSFSTTLTMQWDTNLLLEQHFMEPNGKQLSPFG